MTFCSFSDLIPSLVCTRWPWSITSLHGVSLVQQNSSSELQLDLLVCVRDLTAFIILARSHAGSPVFASWACRSCETWILFLCQIANRAMNLLALARQSRMSMETFAVTKWVYFTRWLYRLLYVIILFSYFEIFMRMMRIRMHSSSDDKM